MTARMERILTKLAKKHAPFLLRRNGHAHTLRSLADGLAKEGVLVITGELPESMRMRSQVPTNEWVTAYGDLYQLLTQELFPNHMNIKAVYADMNYPPIVVLQGQVCAVMKALGCYVVPYVAARHNATQLTLPELEGIMSHILRDLEGGDLSRDKWDDVCARGANILRDLVAMPMQQNALTSAADTLFQRIKPPPPPPDFLPEEPPQPETPTEQLFTSDIPMFFQKPPKPSDDDENRDSNPPFPPVPRRRR